MGLAEGNVEGKREGVDVGCLDVEGNSVGAVEGNADGELVGCNVGKFVVVGLMLGVIEGGKLCSNVTGISKKL